MPIFLHPACPLTPVTVISLRQSLERYVYSAAAGREADLADAITEQMLAGRIAPAAGSILLGRLLELVPESDLADGWRRQPSALSAPSAVNPLKWIVGLGRELRRLVRRHWSGGLR